MLPYMGYGSSMTGFSTCLWIASDNSLGLPNDNPVTIASFFLVGGEYASPIISSFLIIELRLFVIWLYWVTVTTPVSSDVSYFLTVQLSLKSLFSSSDPDESSIMLNWSSESSFCFISLGSGLDSLDILILIRSIWFGIFITMLEKFGAASAFRSFAFGFSIYEFCKLFKSELFLVLATVLGNITCPTFDVN